MSDKLVIIINDDRIKVNSTLIDSAVEAAEPKPKLTNLALKSLKINTHRGEVLSPYRDHAWPLPGDHGYGEWQECKDPGPLIECRNGIHSFLPIYRQPYEWISHKLYVVQLDGEIKKGLRKVVSRRARLIREVPSPSILIPNWSDYRDSSSSYRLNGQILIKLTEEEKEGMIDGERYQSLASCLTKGI